MSHSKRNTSRAVFTSYERSLAKAAWSVSSARLTRESFLPFASCSLCLELAQDPVACPAGDIFCRECALNNILSQKKEMRRLEKTREQDEKDRAERQARDDAEAQARAVQEFELVQAGLEAKRGKNTEQQRRTTNNTNSSYANGSTTESPASTTTATPATTIKTKLLEDGSLSDTAGPRPGNNDVNDNDDDQQQPSNRKRKFTLDADELQRIANEDRSKARRAIEADRAAAHDARALPSFWTPSETPSSTSRIPGIADTKKNGNGGEGGAKAASGGSDVGSPLCPAGHDRHTYSLHTLVSIQFDVDSQGQRTCPACNKMLTNSSKAVLAKPCGHVLCRSCVHQFVKPPGANGQAALFDPHAPPGTTGTVRCYVCEADLEEVPGDSTRKDKKDKRDKKDKKEKKKDRVKPGLVDLRSEGTGFSAGGASEVKKNGIAFQC